jgi:hypothetical protein
LGEIASVSLPPPLRAKRSNPGITGRCPSPFGSPRHASRASR